MDEGTGLAAALVMLVVGFIVYFAPAFIAGHRGRDGTGMIWVLNLLLGWTVIGWVVLLLIAFTGENADDRARRDEELALLRKMAANKASQEPQP